MGDTGEWDAVIDVSNVCWSPYLPPAGLRRPQLERLRLVMAAWRALHGDEAHFYLVADESLARAIDDDAGLNDLKESGDLLTAPVADAVLLPLARDRRLHVISRDHYIDHRHQHPWIERSPRRFHGWDTVDGEVRISLLGITAAAAQEVSMARERKDLKRTRLDPKNPLHRRVLHTRWKCENTSCPQSAHWQGQLLVWPLVSAEGEAMCPSCDMQLAEIGPRQQIHEIVVAERATQAELMRFPLEADVPVIVGRGSTIKGVDLSMATLPFQPGMSDRSRSTAHLDAVRRVSRMHLLLRYEEVAPPNWRLAVIDLESTNGTEVERWAGHGFLPSRPVPTDKELFLSGKDRLVLGGTVQLRLSGRRFVTDTPGQSVPPGQVTPPSGLAPAAGDTTIIDHPILERRRSDPPS
jgi:FHA domain